jgi:hypothetical protein
MHAHTLGDCEVQEISIIAIPCNGPVQSTENTAQHVHIKGAHDPQSSDGVLGPFTSQPLLNELSSDNGAPSKSKISSKTIDKGKRREETPICNVPEHTNTKVPIDTADPDVIVAVDLVVGGQKIKARVVPMADDNETLKPRRLRKESAQQALEYVLASSPTPKQQVSKSPRKHPYQRYPRRNNQQRKETSQKEESTVVVLGTPGPESVTAHEVERGNVYSNGTSQGLWSTLSGLMGNKEEDKEHAG